jgi:hypothetical protein
MSLLGALLWQMITLLLAELHIQVPLALNHLGCWLCDESRYRHNAWSASPSHFCFRRKGSGTLENQARGSFRFYPVLSYR